MAAKHRSEYRHKSLEEIQTYSANSIDRTTVEIVWPIWAGMEN